MRFVSYEIDMVLASDDLASATAVLQELSDVGVRCELSTLSGASNESRVRLRLRASGVDPAAAEFDALVNLVRRLS